MPVWARIIEVGHLKETGSIKAAIALARDGDTLLVYPGSYREGSLVIQKSIVLRGVNYPVIDGEFKHEIFLITGRQVTLSGFLIRDPRHSSSNDYAAVKITDATQVTVENNVILNSNFGVHIANSTYCVVRGNRVTGNAVSEQSAGNGVHIWKSDHITVSGNRVSRHRDGIYFEFVTDSYIRDNISEQNIRYGLHFMFSHNDTYVNNVFRNNGTGVAVMYTHNVLMTGNTFEKNWGTASYAILLKDITDSQMKGNRFLENTIGIFMEGGNRITMERNVFKSNGWAMKVQANCTDNRIRYNNFLGNTFDVATNGTLVLSDFRSNYWDKYNGYDINKDGVGDIPYHPVSMYSMVIEQNPSAVFLLRSFMVSLLDRAEKAIPSLTPENLVDPTPTMRPYK
ncbi:MAG: nitrous oxide reductase family maturation protein NosD [Chitinophagaceae bacterium]